MSFDDFQYNQFNQVIFEMNADNTKKKNRNDTNSSDEEDGESEEIDDISNEELRMHKIR